MANPAAAGARDPESGWHVWGQRHAVAELRHALNAGPSHAYIFAGPAQVGKRTAAIDFARALSCRADSRPDSFCGECSSCRRIGKGVYPDVTVFDLKGQAERDREKSRNLTLTIATIREAIAAVAYRPAEAPWRVVIVDDAETMQETAQEAFLKTLEEPPSYAIIVLVTSDIDSLLPTIRSRCTAIRFGLATTEEIADALAANGASASVADKVTSLAEGELGWALAASRNEALADERAQRRAQALAYISADPYERMVTSIRLGDEFAKDRESVFARLRTVQGVWRAALYHHEGVALSGGLQLGDAEQRLSRVTLPDIVRAIRSVDACMENLSSNVRPRLALETMVSAWPPLDW